MLTTKGSLKVVVLIAFFFLYCYINVIIPQPCLQSPIFFFLLDLVNWVTPYTELAKPMNCKLGSQCLPFLQMSLGL
jgi:hypothetical protein